MPNIGRAVVQTFYKLWYKVGELFVLSATNSLEWILRDLVVARTLLLFIPVRISTDSQFTIARRGLFSYDSAHSNPTPHHMYVKQHQHHLAARN